MIKKIICLLAFAFVLTPAVSVLPAKGELSERPSKAQLQKERRQEKLNQIKKIAETIADPDNRNEFATKKRNTGLTEEEEAQVNNIDEDNLFMIYLNGKKYVLRDFTRVRLLVDQLGAIGGDPCFIYQSRKASNPNLAYNGALGFMHLITASCEEAKDKLLTELRAHGVDPVAGAYTKIGNIGDKTKGTTNQKLSEENALRGCIITNAKLTKQIEILRNRPDNVVKLTVPVTKTDNLHTMVQKCLNSVRDFEPKNITYGFGINNQEFFTQSCDKDSWIEDGVVNKIIDSIAEVIFPDRDLVFNVVADLEPDTSSWKSYDYFVAEQPVPVMKKVDVAEDSMFVYTNGALVLCENDKASKLVYPVYSGREECQTSQYSGVPDIGGVPAGIYLLMSRDAQDMRELGRLPGKELTEAEIWGNWRTILNPESGNEMYGRSSMYLHGREDATKIKERRTAGCINVGWKSTDIVRDEIRNKNRNILLYVVEQKEVPSRDCADIEWYGKIIRKK